MKKIYIAMAVAATAMLVSCQKEQPFEGLTPLKKGDVAFVIQNSATKSSDAAPVATGLSLDMGRDKQGNVYCFEESIENLNPTPTTKGAPAYTVNVGSIYTSMDVYADGNFGDAVFEVMDSSFGASDDSKHIPSPQDGNIQYGWRYVHNYAANPWPDDSTPVDFYLNMPASPTNVTITKREPNEEGKPAIEFTYTSPSTAAAQQDIIFGQTSISKSQHNGYLPNGAPVLMYHALTGIKFRNGHANNNPTKTIITKVKWSGLKSTGTCTVSPESSDIVVWEGLDDATTFTQTFKNQAWSADAGVDGTVAYNKDTENPGNNKFGDSWYAAGNDANNPTNTHNLNDEDGSLTFWFIPQLIDASVTLEVTFLVKTKDTPDGTEIPLTLNIGEQLAAKNVEWKAGELRTYTLRPTDVDVKIVDKMAGLKKSDLHVTNTGNVDEYVRIMIIGNWYGWETQADKNNGKEPDIMVGYTTDGSTGNNTMVEPWFREDPVYGQYFDSSFTGGHPAAGRTDWVRGTGSYFYYTKKIGPGASVSSQDSGTSPLFESYELPADKIPTIYIPVTTSNVRVPAVGVHLKMEIVIQAIGTTKPDGTEYDDCWAAWSAAIGKEIKEKPYTD